MPKKEAPLGYLEQFIPPESTPLILDYLHRYKVHLTITRERKTVLGDYRNATHLKNHRISINGGLNKYSFLITLIHELAHLVVFMQFGNRVASHGKEWRFIYRKMLEDFIRLNIFSGDILSSLEKSLHHLPASSCADEDLVRVLKRYDKSSQNLLLVEQLGVGDLFKIENGKIFQKGKKLRKRIQCVEIDTGRLYLFSPVYEVKAV